MTVVGHQFITLTADICVQHGGREAASSAALSAAAKTCLLILRFDHAGCVAYFAMRYGAMPAAARFKLSLR